MTKAQLIERLAAETNIPKVLAERLVTAFLDAMTDALARGDGIEIRGFGSFSVREYRGYKGRNPRTGEKVAVAPKRMPFFRAGKELKERINDR